MALTHCQIWFICASFQTDEFTREKSSSSPPDFETVLEYVGRFGWSQRIHVAILCGANWIRGLSVMIVLFLGKTPDFHCKDRPVGDPCTLKPSCQEFVYDNADNITSAVSEVCTFKHVKVKIQRE